MPEIVSLRQHPELLDTFISYFQSRWASEASKPVYSDCMTACLTAETPLPQWYLLMEEGKILGGAGLITNDFISRMDLYPWICALYIEEEARGHQYGSLLLEQGRRDAGLAGFPKAYLATDHIGFYEKYGFRYIGTGYHPWGDDSRIYEADSL